MLHKFSEHIQHFVLRSISVLLASLFWVIIFGGLLHHHQEIPKTDDAESYYTPEKCDVCDYCFHKSGKDSIYTPLVFFVFVKSVICILLTGFVLASYKFTLQGFTNKGPPAVII